MKKTLISLLIAGIFLACNKDVVLNSPTAKKDPSLVKDTTFKVVSIVVPNADTVISSWVLPVGDALGMTAIGASVSFSSTGFFKPSRALQDVYFVVKDAGAIVFTSVKNPTVNDAVNSFTQSTFMGFAPAKSYLIELHAKVLASATDDTGPDDQCTPTFSLVYQSDGSQTNKTLTELGQTMTYRATRSSTLALTSVPVYPPRYDFVSGEEFEYMTSIFSSTGGTSTVPSLTFRVGGDVNVRKGIQKVLVYEGVSLVGTGTFDANFTATVPINIAVVPGTPRTLSTHFVVGASSVTDLVSSTTDFTEDVVGILSDIKYVDAGGITKTIYGDESYKFCLLKSRQTVTSVALPGIIQNGALTDGCKFKVESFGGKSSNHQFPFTFVITDNPTHVDTLYYKDMYVKVNNSTITARLTTITNGTEKLIDSVGTGITKVFVTFVSGTGEVITNPGPGTEFVIGGRWGGFNHPLDPDNASIELDTSRVDGRDYRYLNSGQTPNNLISKIYSSSTANAGAVMSGYIWSDYSATGHVAFLPGSSPMDAKTAARGIVFNTFKQVWHQ